jgi:LPXTG-motif cell wall-anchored protein
MKKTTIALASTILLLSSVSANIVEAVEVTTSSTEVESTTQRLASYPDQDFDSAQELINYLNNDTSFNVPSGFEILNGNLTLTDVSDIVDALVDWQERGVSAGINFGNFYELNLGQIIDYSNEKLQEIDNKIDAAMSSLGDNSSFYAALNFSDDITKESDVFGGRYLPGETIQLKKGQANYTLDLSKYGVSDDSFEDLYLGVNDDIQNLQNKDYDISGDKIENLASVDFSDLDASVKTLNLYYTTIGTLPVFRSTSVWKHLFVNPDGGQNYFGPDLRRIVAMYSIPIEWTDPVAGGDVTVKYVDEDGNSISDDVVINGNVDEEYTTEEKIIDGYTFKEVQGNATGQFTNQAQTVTYVYTKNLVAGGDVTVKYVDEDGNSISDDVVINGNVDEEYTTEEKIIDGYTFKEVQGNATGQFTNQAQTVTYVYTKNPVAGGDVTVKYVDEDGNPIAADVVISGNVDEKYTTDQKAIDGYTFKEVQGNANGQFTDQAQTVTYVYTKNPVAGGDVTVKYVDEDGNPIAADVVISGNVDEKYTTEEKTIDGYTFKEVQGNANGQFTNQAQTVTYVYTKNPVAGGDVTVKYVDEDGNPIADDVVKTGNVDEKYTTDQKTIDGYTFKEVQGNATGQFTDQAQTVTYVYTKNPVAGGDVTVKYVDEEGNSIAADVVKTGNVDEKYTTDQKTIDGYTFKEVQGNATGQFTDQAQTVTYVYTKNPVAGGDVTVKYVDEAGNSIAADVVKTGNVDEKYTTDQKTIDGYTFKEVQGNATGQFTDQAQTVTYVYTKDPAKGNPGHSNSGNTNNGNTNSNKPTTKNLPKTGEQQTATLSILGSLIVGLAGIVAFVLKRKKTN